VTLVVSLRQVGVRYGARHALVDVNLDVAGGERVALVGQSGAGKTTLLRVCADVVAPSDGVATILGQRLHGLTERDARAVRRRVATIHQQLNLVGPLRTIHNVNAGRLGSWSTARALWSLLRPVEVGTARAALARLGIEDKLYERTDRLSGGEQQRVALARVLVQRPDLILADEPVSSLDPSRSDEVVSLLTDIVAGNQRALIVSLHDFDLARRRCDRLVGLRQGRVVFDLPASQVTDQHGIDLYRTGS
jgi:phosphonate transport system ATP-binding protein